MMRVRTQDQSKWTTYNLSAAPEGHSLASPSIIQNFFCLPCLFLYQEHLAQDQTRDTVHWCQLTPQGRWMGCHPDQAEYPAP